jgi:hypothetical protein
MISDHHGRITGIATSLLTATDEILGTRGKNLTAPAKRFNCGNQTVELLPIQRTQETVARC